MTDLVHLLAAVAFIVGLRRLSGPRTARSGNLLAAVGMLVALVVTLVAADIVDWPVVAAALLLGTAIGVVWARRVAMTSMPQMVAALHGVGGVAAALVAGAELLAADQVAALPLQVTVPVLFALAVGSVTFTGSFVAFGKLQGIVTGRAIGSRGLAALTGSLGVASIGLVGAALVTHSLAAYLALAVAMLVLGLLAVLPVGGADMPVVVSLLNSLSGLAATGTGFAIGNTALIIGGALVGSAGFILTVQMCDAMNRSLTSVLLAGLRPAPAAVDAAAGDRPVRAATPDDVGIALAYANRVVVIPGYGLAVAQAQHELRKLAAMLEARGVRVDYAIHPVAGRMPGHMNVLLAEADVPYEQLQDLDVANESLTRADVALVVGANDVVNPSARDDTSSPIFGMPILEADRAATVVVVKRSLSAGYAGVDNPLFYEPSTMMLFADAGKAVRDVASALEGL